MWISFLKLFYWLKIYLFCHFFSKKNSLRTGLPTIDQSNSIDNILEVLIKIVKIQLKHNLLKILDIGRIP